ncbi:hypothetical protein [Anaerotignum sp.]
MLKKVICSVLAFSMILSLSVCGYARDDIRETELTYIPDYINIVKDEVSQATLLDDLPMAHISGANYIIHNEGAPMQSDYFAEGKDEGNHLIAVTIKHIGNQTMEHAYFTNSERVDLNTLNDIITDNVYAEEEAKLMEESGSARATKRYSWTFEGNNDSSKYTKLTTTVYLTKQTSSEPYNNTTASIWDISTFSQLERKTAVRLNEMVTRIDVDQSAQALLSYGPTGNSSGGEVSVNFDPTTRVPSVGYSFDIEGFSMRDLSSMSGNYGRWRFYDNIGNQASLATEPGVRAANTKGDFVVELSHTVDFKATTSTSEQHGTGVIQIYTSDR